MQKRSKIKLITSMPKHARLYLKKPIPLRAVSISEPFVVFTETGRALGKKGDYLIEGVKGNMYICKKAWFNASYRRVT